MKRAVTAAVAAAFLAGCGAVPAAVPEPGDRPLRVMSMNLCTDQLVLALLPSERITSVSWLSRDPGASLMHAEAAQVGSNEGAVEEVIRDRPDLVIAGTFTTPATRAMLRRMNYPLLELGSASSFEDIRTLTRQLATAVGEEARGEALITAMDRELAVLAAEQGPPIRIAAWDRTGFSGAAGTLQDEVFRAAGARNVATEDTESSARPDIEQLLAAAPALLVQGSPDAAEPSFGEDLATHPLVGRFWPPARRITIPQAFYACGTPMIARAVRTLRDQLRAAAATDRPVPAAS